MMHNDNGQWKVNVLCFFFQFSSTDFFVCYALHFVTYVTPVTFTYTFNDLDHFMPHLSLCICSGLSVSSLCNIAHCHDAAHIMRYCL